MDNKHSIPNLSRKIKYVKIREIFLVQAPATLQTCAKDKRETKFLYRTFNYKICYRKSRTAIKMVLKRGVFPYTCTHAGSKMRLETKDLVLWNELDCSRHIIPEKQAFPITCFRVQQKTRNVTVCSSLVMPKSIHQSSYWTSFRHSTVMILPSTSYSENNTVQNITQSTN